MYIVYYIETMPQIVTVKTFFLETTFHAVYYISTMPRFVTVNFPAQVSHSFIVGLKPLFEVNSYILYQI